MKKILISLLVIIFAFTLTACGGISTPNNLSFSERTLSWDKVDGAIKYIVEINGEEHETDTNSYKIEDGTYGTLEMRVKAIGKTQSEFSSKITETATWKLTAPTGLVQNGGQITWNEVPFALGYVVSVGGIQYSTQTTSYNFNANSPVSVKVLAVGDEENGLMHSDYSSEITLSPALQTPVLSLNKTIISWQVIDGAGCYEVYLDGTLFDTVITTEYDFKWEFVGTKQVTVKAIATQGNGYLNSNVSQALSVTLNAEILAVPSGLTLQNGVLSWDTVEGASSYLIYNNGEEYTTVNTNSFVISNDLKNADTSAVQVQALGEPHIASSLSEEINVGKYSELNPVEITSSEEFGAIIPTGHYKLTEDLDLSSYAQIAKFSGTLDGNGHKITGLTQALFGVVEGGKISNLTIENASINVETQNDSSSIGVIANELVNATIKDCTISANLMVKSNNGVTFVGMVAGRVDYSNILGVKINGTITTEYCTVGGLVGWANNSTKESEISKCQVTATINAIGGESENVGGFIGKVTNNALTISQCVSKVEIETSVSYAGGFVGFLGSSKQIVDCYALGEVISTNAVLSHVGGFIGRMDGYNNKVVRSIAMVTVSSNADVNKLGGFAGNTVGGNYAGNIYENCYYDSTLAPIDRIGNNNGRGDGISAKSTEELKTLEYSNGYLSTVWVLGNNQVPSLVIELI